MRVSELLSLLGQLDPSMEILVHANDGGCEVQFFDIQGVDLARAARSRDADGTPRTVLDAAQGRPLALLTLTADY